MSPKRWGYEFVLFPCTDERKLFTNLLNQILLVCKGLAQSQGKRMGHGTWDQGTGDHNGCQPAVTPTAWNQSCPGSSNTHPSHCWFRFDPYLGSLSPIRSESWGQMSGSQEKNKTKQKPKLRKCTIGAALLMYETRCHRIHDPLIGPWMLVITNKCTKLPFTHHMSCPFFHQSFTLSFWQNWFLFDKIMTMIVVTWFLPPLFLHLSMSVLLDESAFPLPVCMWAWTSTNISLQSS